MSKRSAGAIVAVIGLGAVLWVVGQRVHSEKQAEELASKARALLEEGIETAPSLADIRATEARRLGEEALRHAKSDGVQALVQAARAIELLARGDVAGAAQARAKTLPALADMPVLRVLDVRILETRGLPAEARSAAEALAARSPEDARVLLLSAAYASRDGRTDAALALLDRAIEKHPKAAALYEQRGLTHELLSSASAARADYERAAAADRNAVTPLLQLGRLLHDMGHPSEGLLAFRSALHRDPRNVDARMGLGVCRREIADHVGARMDFEEAFALDPNHVQAHLALGDMDLVDGKLDDALLHYRRAVQLDKQSATAWVKLGNALVRMQAHDQAAMAFESAIRIEPSLAAAHNGLGAAMLASGDAAAAEKALSAAAELDATDPNPLLNLAVLRKHNGDERGARAAFAQAQERDPSLEVASLTGLGRRTASSARHP